MAKDFGRDLDIGIPTAGNLSKTVVVSNFSEVTNKLDESTVILDASLADGNANLEKIEANTALAISKEPSSEVE